MSLTAESFSNTPLSEIIPSYAYFQYSDDEDIQAFISSYNGITQSYLDWFLTTPLSVYTSSSISGVLLDWIGQSLYGYARPFLITGDIVDSQSGGYGFSVMGEMPYATYLSIVTPGTATSVSDDIYKRALTWHLYLGDGKQMTIQWMKRRIARFLYGANGADVSIDYLQNVSITFGTEVGGIGYYGDVSFFGDTSYFGGRGDSYISSKVMTITLPNITVAPILKSLLENGFLALPFQVNVKVLIS